MGLFNKIFGKKDSSVVSTGPFVNPIQVEFHSHLIPGVDDGVETIEQSLEILQNFHELGMRKVITTPHIMSDYYKNGPENLIPLRDTLREKLAEMGIPLELEVAAEYMVDDAFDKKIESGNLLTFGPKKKHILIELPFMSEPNNFKKVLFELQIAGYKPILAHPERYLYMGNNRSRYEELKDQGILFQVNMLSLLGYYSKQVQESAFYLIDHEMIDLIGSDTHHMRHFSLLPEVIEHKYYRKVCELELLNNNL
ncbi:MAG: tyrosine-protein phosphatase [Bacteroidia bacterium]